MSSPAIPRALPIEFVGDLEVLKPPLHRRQRKVRWARISCPTFLTLLQPNDQELQKFRAIEGPYLPLNLAERLTRLCPPRFHYGLEIGILYSDFSDKLEFWSKEIGYFPSIKQAYGCVNGSGWIINFGHTSEPDRVPVEIRDYFEKQLQVGPPKWYLSLEFPYWRWT